MFEEWHRSLKKILGFISQYKVGGYFPLDILLHIVFSIILLNLFLKLKLKFKWAFLMVLTMELIKEFYDSFVLESTLLEHLKDIVVTMAYPLLLSGIRFFKSK